MVQTPDKEGTDSPNIFEEFVGDKSLYGEIDDAEKQQSRTSLFYFSKIESFLKITNLIFFMGLTVIGGYLYIQNQSDLNDAPYLNSICHVFLGDTKKDDKNCASLTYSLYNYKTSNTALEELFFTTINKHISDVYALSHYVYSKEALFLLDKTKNRLRPLDIFEKFDNIKNEYDPSNKLKIVCRNMIIQEGGILDVSCSAYSVDWNKDIIGMSGKSTFGDAADGFGDKTEGSSLSVASSFMNFLEKRSEHFTILSKTKKLQFDEIPGGQGYSRKTDFHLRLRFNGANTNISLLQ